MAKKVRLDQLIVLRGLAESRTKAQALILAGNIRVAGAAQCRPGDLVAPEIEIIRTGELPYASRGGYKLAHALDTFGLAPAGCIALDVGASTGGFTDVLLQRGAAQVYAVDVGYGLLDWRLRQDPRVVVVERTNIRYLEQLPDAGRPTLDDGAERSARVHRPSILILADCATIDVAFISLRLVLPAVKQLITPEAWVIALIKPQFEAGQAEVDRGSGVVRDPRIHRTVIADVLTFAESLGLPPHGVTRSPITGPAGNSEFLAWLGGPGPSYVLSDNTAQELGL